MILSGPRDRSRQSERRTWAESTLDARSPGNELAGMPTSASAGADGYNVESLVDSIGGPMLAGLVILLSPLAASHSSLVAQEPSCEGPIYRVPRRSSAFGRSTPSPTTARTRRRVALVLRGHCARVHESRPHLP